MRLISLLGLFGLIMLSGCASNPHGSAHTSAQAAEVNADLGLGYMQQGDNKRAKEKLDRALEQNPKLPRAHHYSAELYKRLGDNKQADKHYQRAVELQPTNASLRNNYGVFLCRQGRFNEAEDHLLLAIGDPLYERKTEAYENLGICAADAGQLDKAENYLRAALRANPRLQNALYRLATVKFAQKNYLNARAYLQRYEEVGNDTAASLWLGIRIEKAMGDEVAMGTYAQRLGRQFPDSPEWAQFENMRW